MDGETSRSPKSAYNFAHIIDDHLAGHVCDKNLNSPLEETGRTDAWVAQAVKCWTRNFRSRHDLRIMRSSPEWGSALGVDPA